MKTIFKNKKRLLLAIISIAVIASMLLAGTYAWMVQSAGGKDEDKKTLTAAMFELKVIPGDPPVVKKHINWETAVTNSGHYTTGAYQYPITSCKCAGDDNCYDFSKVPLLYPGDAVQYTSRIEITHNREILVKIDFRKSLGNAFTDVLDAYNEDTDGERKYNKEDPQ
jgi:hypothetical protein